MIGPGATRSLILAAMVLGGLANAVAGEAGAPVPARFRGVWAMDGRCGAAGSRLVITAGTARLGRDKAAAVILTPRDGPNGEDALHWAEEGNVDNFVGGRNADEIRHNLEGYGMGKTETYRRCGR